MLGRSVYHQINESENVVYDEIYKVNGFTSIWMNIHTVRRELDDIWRRSRVYVRFQGMEELL